MASLNIRALRASLLGAFLMGAPPARAVRVVAEALSSLTIAECGMAIADCGLSIADWRLPSYC